MARRDGLPFPDWSAAAAGLPHFNPSVSLQVHGFGWSAGLKAMVSRRYTLLATELVQRDGARLPRVAWEHRFCQERVLHQSDITGRRGFAAVAGVLARILREACFIRAVFRGARTRQQRQMAKNSRRDGPRRRCLERVAESRRLCRRAAPLRIIRVRV